MLVVGVHVGPTMKPGMMKQVTISTTIETLLSEEFPPNLRDQARHILKPEQGDRVLRAVLTLSEGSLDRLQHLTDVASIDWRDVVHWAEDPIKDDEPRSLDELRMRLHLPPES